MLTIDFTPISDDPILSIKRAVSWDSFVVLKKQKLIQLTTNCHYFETDALSLDGYGKEIVTKGLKPFERTFYASNERKVNPVNGRVCEMKEVTLGQNADGTPIREMQMLDILGNQVLNPIGQFDFFLLIVRTQPTVIELIIKDIILQEDSYYGSFNN
jgi:hypothetical protein